MIPFTRIITVLMFGVLCFLLIVPMALQRHNTPLAVGIGALFIVYLVINLVLWRKMNRRA